MRNMRVYFDEKSLVLSDPDSKSLPDAPDIGIYPKFDRVLIKRDTLEDDIRSRASKLLLPQDVKRGNMSETGTVVAVGPVAGYYKGDELIESIVVGSKVIFATHAGVEVKPKSGAAGGGVYFLIQDNDILAEIRDN